MQILAFQTPQVLGASGKGSTKKKRLPVFPVIDSLPFASLVPIREASPCSSSLRCRETTKSDVESRRIRTRALNVGAESGGYEESQENNSQSSSTEGQHSDASSRMLSLIPLVNS